MESCEWLNLFGVLGPFTSRLTLICRGASCVLCGECHFYRDIAPAWPTIFGSISLLDILFKVLMVFNAMLTGSCTSDLADA